MVVKSSKEIKPQKMKVKVQVVDHKKTLCKQAHDNVCVVR